MIEFKVAVDGQEPYTVTAESRDVLVWEKTSKGKSLADLKDSISMVDLYKLAHIASRRVGVYDGSLADFEANANLDFEVSTSEPDPTQPAPSTGQ